MPSLNNLNVLRIGMMRLKHRYLTKVWGMDIHPTVLFSLKANFDRTHPKGVHVGPESYVTFGVVILTHDRTRGLYLDTRIGARCFIGAHSIIMPGVEIGDECVVGAGSVVTKSVPPRCIVAGNPARIVRENIAVGPYGRFLDADETERRLRAQMAEGRPAERSV